MGLEELAGAAILHFERNELAAALVLTRSAAECSAATWYLMEIVEDFNSDGTLELLDERAEKLLLGFKDNPEMPSAINVLTMFDRANKTVPGIKRNYEALSEYAHPNWSGTSLLFAQLDREKLLTMFGKNARAKNGPIGFGLNSLGLALTVFAHSYNRVSEAFPTLIAKCEAALPKS